MTKNKNLAPEETDQKKIRPLIPEETDQKIQELRRLYEIGAKGNPRLEKWEIIDIACNCMKAHLSELIAQTFDETAEKDRLIQTMKKVNDL